jgi:N-methylhydantoinase A
MSYFIGIDTGGTFTDCVVMDREGRLTVGKAASTPGDFSAGIVESVKVTANSMGMTLEELLGQTTLFSHATTTATNALITRSGAKTGLITTAGFEDTILIMRIKGRYAGLGEEAIKHLVKREKPVPLIPKVLIRGVQERVDYKGEIVTPLNRDSVIEAVRFLADRGVEAIAIALLWAQANPSHEQEIKRIVNEMYPDFYVSTSSDLVPLLGEYERTSTTAINAYLGPLVSKYLWRLGDRLGRAGYRGSPLVAQSHGGCLGLEETAQRPVGMINSGPVAGIIGAKYLADLLGYENVITADMGGTSFDVGLIYRGTPQKALETVVTQYHVLVPTIAVDSIGAGGGSIAWVEPVTNLLKVGPRSAGADPGPACYNIGGTEPTVTDADLVLGYLNPDYFLGGRMKLHQEKATQAIKTKIADHLGIDVAGAAMAIYDIVNSHMSDLIRSMTVGKGYDPRQCVLIAYGGAGPLHASAYAREAMTIVVPSTASVHSAMGALASDIVHTYQLSVPMKVPADSDLFNSVFASMETRAIDDLRKDRFKEEDTVIARYVDMRYMRQVHEVTTPCPGGRLSSEDLEKVYTAFETLYEKLYGKGSAYREAGMQIITFRVEARGRITKPKLIRYEMNPPDPSAALKTKRQTFLHGKSTNMDVYDFNKLQAGNMVPGPAIIETPTTTILIDSDQMARLDEWLNTIIVLKEAS